jgi:signal transduction histidine kinase
MAKRVAELHGGTLALTFPASGGTSVKITAPLTPRTEGH